MAGCGGWPAFGWGRVGDRGDSSVLIIASSWGRWECVGGGVRGHRCCCCSLSSVEGEGERGQRQVVRCHP
jgi:hypothetical protein